MACCLPSRADVGPEGGGDELREVADVGGGKNEVRGRQAEVKQLGGDEGVPIQFFGISRRRARIPVLRPETRGQTQGTVSNAQVAVRPGGVPGIQQGQAARLPRPLQLAPQFVIRDRRDDNLVARTQERDGSGDAGDCLGGLLRVR